MISPSATRPRWLLGAVLAGGASTRFGSPKWRAPVGGSSMGERASAALAPHTRRVVAIGHDPGLVTLGLAVRPDLEPGLGPLGAVHTALAWAAELSLDGVFVLACDLPLVSGALVGRLVGAWREEDAVVPLRASGPEPLCALYGLALLPRVAAALGAGERSPARFLEGEGERARWVPVEGSAVSPGGGDPFLNVNTPGARERAERALRSAAGARREEDT